MVRHSGETERISAQHRHRCRRTPLRTADSGHRAGRLPDLPHALGTAPATTPAADSRWRPDWLRADADLRPFQRSGDTGRNGATHIMIREDPEVSELVMARFRSEDIAVLVNHRAKELIVNNSEKILISEHAGEDVRIPFDALLVAVGQVANLSGYGLDELGIVAQRTKSTTSTGRSRWGSAWLHQGADRTGQGPPPRRHPRWRTRRRPDCRIRAGDAARHRSEQDPWHHPHLSDTCRSQQVRRR